MTISNIHEAKTRLSKLIEQAEGGQEVIIARAGKPVARLIPYQASEKPRSGGQWRGKVRIAKDFDHLPTDIAAAFAINNDKQKKSAKK